MKFVSEGCTGCRACEQRCPVSCITMREDENGFLRAVIEDSRCVDCRLCHRLCPVEQAETDDPKSVKSFWAVKRLPGQNPVFPCSSAGIFAALAQEVIRSGGVVFGAKLEKVFGRMACAQREEELPPLCGSKYVQCDTADSFAQVKAFLQQSRRVLYAGTPCQIYGLKAYLGKDDPNLLTCDFICHGVPSPRLFEAYIRWLESKRHGAIESYRFRLQENSRPFLLQYSCRDKKGRSVVIKRNGSCDPYYHAFLQHESLRDCCYNCRFSGFKRASDLTVADFWGAERLLPAFADGSRISWLMIHSDTGAREWAAVRDGFAAEPIDTACALAEKKLELRQDSMQRQRVFYQQICQHGFAKYARAYRHSLPFYKEKLRACLPSKAVKLLKTIKRSLKRT